MPDSLRPPPRDPPSPPAGSPPDGRERPALDLLIWDAPNIDMTLSTVIGARPTAASRPRFDAIAAWFVEGAGDPSLPDAPDVEACVFANIPPAAGHAAALGGGAARLRLRGVRPAEDASPTTTSTRTCSTTSRSGRTATGCAGWSSSPATGATSPIRWSSSSATGTHVVVVAFSEVAGYAISSELLEFIDIEDVPGAFVEPLDRVRLDALPPDGAWLRPTRSLREFVGSFTARRDR